mgnify:CR=1 FL=1
MEVLIRFNGIEYNEVPTTTIFKLFLLLKDRANCSNLKLFFFFDDMRLLLKLQLILYESITDMYNHIFILRPVDINADMTLLKFLTLSNIRGTSNSHPERKTVFTRAQGLQGMIFKLNPYNASAEARTPSLTFVRE